jgi:hypothetical protein
MNQLTPADAATLGMTETELAHLCDQYQAAEFYPAITPEERTEAAARVVLTAAGFAESPPMDGWAESAAHWPFGFMLDEYPGRADITCVHHWDQIYTRDSTPDSRGAHLEQLGRYADALRAAGYTVTLQTAPGERPWLHATR